MGNDHVEAGGLGETRNLDFLNRTEMGNERESQVGSILAGTALANRVSFDEFQALVEILERTDTLVDQVVAWNRFAGFVEENSITLDL